MELFEIEMEMEDAVAEDMEPDEEEAGFPLEALIAFGRYREINIDEMEWK